MLMPEISSFVAAATFGGAVIALVMTAVLWNRRQAPRAAGVAWLMIAAALWSSGYGIEVLQPHLDDKLILVPFEYIGIMTVPVFWLITSIIAGIIPIGANVLFVANLSSLSVFDPTSMSFAASGAIIAFGYIRFRLFDLVSVAIDVLVERIPEAMFVLDGEGDIVDANSAAERMAATGGKRLVGMHLCDSLPGDLAARHELCSRNPSFFIHDFVVENPLTLKPVIYSPTVSDLSDHPGDAEDSTNELSARQQANSPNGRLLILRDVTQERKASETLRRLARITTVNAINADVAEMHDVESIMAKATSRLADLLPADHACGLLLDPDTGNLWSSTWRGNTSRFRSY